ncbi:MAG TPA: hypothetical protein VLB01_06125, partial [Thermodesulfobacteriota bacterium]|nr:hypothetical protein [Thermodesulfobacteriota bacterium]
IVLISPSGVVWRNDDRDGANDRRPLIKADPTDGQGWYTLQISHYSGGGVAGYGDDFTLQYGWYNSGNPNCSNPTPSY